MVAGDWRGGFEASEVVRRVHMLGLASRVRRLWAVRLPHSSTVAARRAVLVQRERVEGLAVACLRLRAEVEHPDDLRE